MELGSLPILSEGLLEPTSPSVPVAELLILPPTDVNKEDWDDIFEQHLPSADGDTPSAHLSDD